MKTTGWIVGLACVLAVGGAAQDELPPGDTYAESWFGLWRSEPIWTGWVFVDGEYLDVPYVVEQRGFAVFVNGRMCARIYEPWLFPGKSVEPLYDDPGRPTDLKAEDSLVQALHHPVSEQKRRYWETRRLSQDEYLREATEYYRSLPNILRVDLPPGEPGSERTFTVVCRDGTSMACLSLPFPLSLPPRIPRERLLSQLNSRRDWLLSTLRTGWTAVVCGGAQISERHPIGVTPRWKEAAAVMGKPGTAVERSRALQGLGFPFAGDPDHLRVSDADLLAKFRATPQFWKRLAGDESWLEDAKKTFVPLPSGQIKPATFGRPPTNAPAPSASAAPGP